jgi:uncharacterized membrane protein
LEIAAKKIEPAGARIAFECVTGPGPGCDRVRMATSRSFMNAWYARPLRIARVHLKLTIALAVGTVLFLLLPGELRITTRLLVAWNVVMVLYLGAACYVIAHSEISHVRKRAAIEDEGAALILALTVTAAAASLAAIFVELAAVQHQQSSAWIVVLTVVTVILSWIFIQVIFMFHYAHEFYGEGRDGQKGGLEFPNDKRPEYSDFVYFSFVIGMTFQVSDVQVTSKSIRRIVVGHGAVSFFYNVAVLALMVNIGGEFIK